MGAAHRRPVQLWFESEWISGIHRKTLPGAQERGNELFQTKALE